MKKLKWGVISTATIALEQVIPAIKKSVNGELQAISSSSGKEIQAAEKFSIPKTYNSHEKLLEDKEIEAVYIPLPNSMHAEWTIKAAEAGKHILCEKPVALNKEEFEQIRQACEANNVYFMEGFMYRFHSQHRKVKELISAGKIGRPLSIQSKFHFTVENPDTDIRMNPELGGGVTYDIGCYSVNVSNYLLDQKPAKLYAAASFDQVDTKLTAVLQYKDGITATIDSSFYGPDLNSYTVTGTKGTLEVPHAFRPDLNEDTGEVILRNEAGEETYRMKEAQYVNEVEHFANTVMDKGELAYPASAAFDNMVTVEAILESAKKEKVITL